MNDFEQRRASLLAEIASLFEFFSYDLAAALERCIEVAQNIKGFDEHALLILKGDGEITPYLSSGLSGRLSGGMQLADIYTGEDDNYVVNEITSSSQNQIFPAAGKIRSYITVPLILRNDVIGLLMLGSIQPQNFNDEDVDLFFSLGSHFAVVIQNIRFYQFSQERLEVITSLQTTYRAITAEEDMNKILSDLAVQSVKTLNVYAMAVYLLGNTPKPDQDIWNRIVFHASQPSATVPESAKHDDLPEPIRRALGGKELVFLQPEEVEDIGSFLFSPRYRDIAILPLRGSQPHAVGFAILQMPFCELDQIRMIELFGSQVQVLFSNALLIKNLKEKTIELERSQEITNEYADRARQTNEMLESRVRELTTLHNVNMALTTRLNIGDTLDYILEEACTVMRSEKGAILLLVHGDELVGRSTKGVQKNAQLRFRLGEGIAGRVARTGQAYISDDITKDPNYKLGSGEIPSIETLICVPLTLENAVIGVLSIEREIAFGVFTPDEKRLLISLGTAAAQAIEKARAFSDLRSLHRQTLEAFAQAVDTKDAYTHGHSRRVSRLSVEIGKILMLSEEEVDCIERAALLHDIGKIGISNNILFKPERLTEEEYEIMKAHVIFGEHIVKPIKRMKKESKLIRHHHERWDGKGYPDGLKGEQIPVGSAIIGVADAYDTMTSDRPYRRAIPKESAMEELLRCSGAQFNPLVVGAFFMFSSRGNEIDDISEKADKAEKELLESKLAAQKS